MSTNMDGSEKQEIYKEYTFNVYAFDVESDGGDGDDYVENDSGPEENVCSKLSSNEFSDNWSS